MKVYEFSQINNLHKKIGSPKNSQGNFNNILKNTLKKSNTKYDHIFEAAGKKWGVDPELIKAVAITESSLNPNAVSKAGARGVMQLMPQTAHSLGVKNSFDPAQNIFGGAKYLRSMLDTFNQDIRLALAAYNAGPGNVKKYGGIPPFKETQKYVKKVVALLDKNQIQQVNNVFTKENTFNKEVKEIKEQDIVLDLLTYINLKNLFLNSKLASAALSIGDMDDTVL